MTYLSDTSGRSRPTSEFDLSELDRIDRILLGGCAAVWLAALGAGVAATVALVDLARGHTVSSGDSGTPWILYTVIAVSAAVIVAAVPLLLRARRAAMVDSTVEAQAGGVVSESEASQSEASRSEGPKPQAAVPGAEAPTEKLRVAPVAPPPEPALPEEPHGPNLLAIDRLWLRCAAGIACAMGIATLLTAVSTYLMAVGSDTGAWVLYFIVGVVTLAMVAIPLYALRELHTLIDQESTVD